ncbi:MAG TPA: AraC family transcriptional regulator [Panacibacter sp.]|nr:AraC family transcriptional regulator [Panacibacter sp.]
MLQIYKPKSKELQKYIELFYEFNSNKPTEISYVAFPHVNTAISFFKGIDIYRTNYNITILSSADNEPKRCIEILGKYTQPVFVHYKGKCEEIAIVFKPLGVNHFFLSNLIEVAPEYSQALNDESWTEFSTVLFTEKTAAERIEMLEIFLLKNLNHFKAENLYKAIKYLEDFDANYSIDKVAEFCGASLKTFQRNFIKHLTCSPLEYKRIARFRHSLNNKLISKEIKTLTNVSYESNYYDQSYFIREYKKLTNLNPKQFFNAITVLDEKNIIWKIK